MRLALLLTAFAPALVSTAQLNIDFVGQLDYQALHNSNLSNLWGYTDELGNEYALVGVNGGGNDPGGISVVSLADPTDPQEVFFFPGPQSIWREIKVWGDHAYVTTEAEGGELTIVDLSPLPQSSSLNAIVWDAPSWSTSHSLFIDENGRLYIHGANTGNGGVIMYDLTQDPMDPVYVGTYDPFYCHDSFARGDTLYAAHILDGFFTMVDVSDPSAPVLLGTKATPNAFTHNTWLDHSGQYLFTTDERTNAYVAAYDITDPTDITEVDRLRSDNGSGAIPHNTYWLNDYVVTSYYTFGVSIYDAGDPNNLVEVGHYDTSPFSGDGFHGAWGVYPFFASGNLIISDIEQGLFVLAPTYVEACLLEGLVSNQVTSAPVGNATIQIISTNAQDITGVDGLYATGYSTAGTFTVQATAPGYYPATIAGVQLVSGQVTNLPIELEPMVPFDITCQVIEAGTSTPIPNASVVLKSANFTLSGTTDANGACVFAGVFSDTYTAGAGRWGWHSACLDAQALTSTNNTVQIVLPAGYADDFSIDLDWEVTGDATTGLFELGDPTGTTNGGNACNPENDAPGDCGEFAYVTGLAGGNAGDDDVDGGSTVLTSPIFDATGTGEAHVSYRRWFYNGGGSGSPNDQMLVQLDNGTTTATLETVVAGASGNSSWLSRDHRIADFLAPTSTMRLIVTTADAAPGHLLEAGIDVFELSYLDVSAIDHDPGVEWSVFPNPASGHVRISVATAGAKRVEAIDQAGRLVASHSFSGAIGDATMDLSAGCYTIRLVGPDGLLGSTKLMMLP
ncbi:MAG: choice-of-anchor B family protein [Flavobacteriales bacterium]|nr:choice-of-anchor B family protein [Flavobacteriales bacterium]